MNKAPLKIMVILVCILNTSLSFADDTADISADEGNNVPLSTIFHNFGWNALHSLTYNYGLNFAGAALGTVAFIETGMDQEWRNFAYRHESLANGAYYAGEYTGWVIPIAAPFAFYFTGLFGHNKKLQITGMALAQSLAIAQGYHAILKMTTGRNTPHIVNQYLHERTDGDFSRDFNWFNMVILDGWPSGHTLSAFTVAATIAEIYSDNLLLKIALYSYAILTGIGVSLNVHWASDVFAGALIGYAVGKTVGRDFKNLISPAARPSKLSLTMTPLPLGILVRF